MGTPLIVLLVLVLGVIGIGGYLRLRRLGGGAWIESRARLHLRMLVPFAVTVLALKVLQVKPFDGDADFFGQLLGTGLILGAFLLLFEFTSALDEILDRIATSFWACVRREIYSFFSTPIPYFVLFLFLALSGLFFWATLKSTGIVSMRYVFDSVSSIGIFLFPLLTMGLLSRERSEGTVEVLMTAPVSEASVVVSKFLGTMAFYAAMLVPTVVYCLVLLEVGSEIGKPDLGPLISAYAGMFLLGAFFVSLGLVASALTSSQILAALIAWVLVICFFLTSGVVSVFGLSGTVTGDVLEFLDPMRRHLRPFLDGVVHPVNVVYFVSFTAFNLYLSVRVFQTRKGR